MVITILTNAIYTICIFHSRNRYRICGNFRGSYISRIACQEDFHFLIFTDDLPLNDYTALDYCLLIEVFED